MKGEQFVFFNSRHCWFRFAAVFILLKCLSPSISSAQASFPVGGDNFSAVFEQQLKEYLLESKGRIPWMYPHKLSRDAVGQFVAQRLSNEQLITYEYRVFQVIDKTSALIRCTSDAPDDEDVLFQLKNRDFSDYVDGKAIRFYGTYRVAGTYQYTTVVGAKKTIYSIEPFNPERIWNEAKTILQNRGIKVDEGMVFRKWQTKNAGRLEALYLEMDGDKALLRVWDGKIMITPLKDLILEDQAWIAATEKVRAERLAKQREWTMVDGSVVVAEFVKQEKSEVILKTRLGEEITIPFKQLSAKDKRWILLARTKSP